MDSDMAKEKHEEPMDVASMSALIEAQRKQIALSDFPVCTEWRSPTI